MDQIHGVEGNSSQSDEWVVAASQEEEGDHVDDSHNTASVAELSCRCRKVLVPVNAPDSESYVGCKVANKEERLEAAGQRADVDSS